MPTIYNQGGLIIVVYYGDHEPIHCHVKFKGMRAKCNYIGGRWQVQYSPHQSKTFRTRTAKMILATVKEHEEEIFALWQK